MESTSVVHKERLLQVVKEVAVHLLRIDEAFEKLKEKYNFPLSEQDFARILKFDLAYADQIIYRFSKAQDSIGAKLLKIFIISQGESAEQPFLDILNSLEKMHILIVEDWFVLRDLRNEIAHNYECEQAKAMGIINNIYSHKNELKNILDAVVKVSGIKLDNKDK